MPSKLRRAVDFAGDYKWEIGIGTVAIGFFALCVKYPELIPNLEETKDAEKIIVEVHHYNH